MTDSDSPEVPAIPSARSRTRLSRWITAFFVVAATIYLVALPIGEAIWEHWHPAPSGKILEEMSLAEQVRQRVIELASACWFFSFGATIGSFLNVLVYRLPRRESVIWRRSRCPSCGNAIAGRDNIPILGWLLLGGRCRHCGTSIAIRYPSVELTMAVVALVFYFVELLSGGANIPRREPNPHTGIVWILFYTKWDLLGLYLIHLFAFASLLTWALLRQDGQKVPVRSWAAALGVVWGATWLIPFHPPLKWLPEPVRSWQPVTGFEQASAATLGIVAAWLIGWFVGRLLRAGRPSVISSRNQTSASGDLAGNSLASWAMGGAIGGWQGILGIALCALFLRALTLVTLRGSLRAWRGTLAGHLFLGTLIHQLGWRQASGWLKGAWPGAATTPWQAAAFVALIVVLACAIRLLETPDEPLRAGSTSESVPHSEGPVESVD